MPYFTRNCVSRNLTGWIFCILLKYNVAGIFIMCIMNLSAHYYMNYKKGYPYDCFTTFNRTHEPALYW